MITMLGCGFLLIVSNIRHPELDSGSILLSDTSRGRAMRWMLNQVQHDGMGGLR